MQILEWSALDAAARTAALARPALRGDAQRRAQVARIIDEVRRRGDEALHEYGRCFDGIEMDSVELDTSRLESACAKIDPAVRTAIDLARDNIRRFHEPSALQDYAVETVQGIVCRRLVRPLTAVGLYVPGGSAPLSSTVLMLGAPAALAGCETVVLCTPPSASGVAPEILYTAASCGIHRIFTLGGAQAIAAMAYGTESVPRVDRIFGPGNAWVTEAKRQVAADIEGADIDMPAGPSELLVIAGADANPVFVAADLLSQAEHGADSQVLLLSPDMRLLETVANELERQLESLPRAATARAALAHARLLHVTDLATAMDVANRYAPEHLILNLREAASMLPRVRNAGSVFLGSHTPESLGDYASGTNHVLPTYGIARRRGGVSVADFQKCITVQEATAEAMRAIGPVVATLARAETLEAHARAVEFRLAEEVAHEPA